MIIYMAEHGQYLSPQESLRRNPLGKRNLYVNITNRCTCDCIFCERHLKKLPPKMSLWLEKEPSVDEIKGALNSAPWQYIGETVFCGFGEPTMRLDILPALLRYIKKIQPQMKTRLNTNGLSDLAYDRSTAEDFAGGILDAVSISLNAPTEEEYLKVTRSRFGTGSFDALLHFAQQCKRYVKSVTLTIVDQVLDETDIQACQRLCQEKGLKLRVRPYEP